MSLHDMTGMVRVRVRVRVMIRGEGEGECEGGVEGGGEGECEGKGQGVCPSCLMSVFALSVSRCILVLCLSWSCSYFPSVCLCPCLVFCL